LLPQDPPVLDFRYQVTQVDLYIDREMVLFVYAIISNI